MNEQGLLSSSSQTLLNSFVNLAVIRCNRAYKKFVPVNVDVLLKRRSPFPSGSWFNRARARVPPLGLPCS